jgi:hypothetical protein
LFFAQHYGGAGEQTVMPKRLNEMEPNMYKDNFKTLILIFLCVLAICYSCISCSNGKKVSKDYKIQNTIPKSIKMELDLIEDCLRGFIISNKEKIVLKDFKITLKSLDGQHRKITTDVWGIGDFVIQYLDSQRPIALYSLVSSDGKYSEMLIISLFKQNGVYKVKEFSSEELFDIEEIIE